MVPEKLEPRVELLHQEYVLVQAWKKTVSYIRYHNWFSDTLELDRTAVNLPEFIGKLRERLQSSESWQNGPLRIVPAPKSQIWRVRDGAWEPVEKKATSTRLRPLAHVKLADQVAATALMLCLADRVETLQGNPKWSIHDREQRKLVISYGNRLFCDEVDGGLRHRWGSAKLYRAYYQDYRKFLSRPQVVAENITTANGQQVYLVHADLRQFYDRVRPSLLEQAMHRLRSDNDDPAFFSLAGFILNWGWDIHDEKDVRIYAGEAELDDFSRVALPQGLVASGFFSNVVLLPFDDALRAVIGTEIASGIFLEDVCRYVDDLRILISVCDFGQDEISTIVCSWLDRLLKEVTPGLVLSPEKTQVVTLKGDERALVRQSSRMNRIQSAVSWGFDAIGGEEILEAIQGLMRAQKYLGREDGHGWRFSPMPDVRDETVARFGAARYRTTFRSIRPLLLDDNVQPDITETRPGSRSRVRLTRTRQELDEDARVFALGLIERWIDDPSNVRLLRIGLDIWPDAEILREVLALLRPFTEKGGKRKAPRRVAWYCLAEVLRAGATETGIVGNTELLPSAIDLYAYREELHKEAARLAGLPGPTIPWYLRQQALLFLAAFDPSRAPVIRTGTRPETRHYWQLIRFLRGEGKQLQPSNFATLAVLARRAFVGRNRAIELIQPDLNPPRLQQLAHRDPSFLLELNLETGPFPFDDLPVRVREDLCQTPESSDGDPVTLSAVVLHSQPGGTLRNELSILRFAKIFLKEWGRQDNPQKVITPGQVRLQFGGDPVVSDVKNVQITESRAEASGSMYEVPAWSKDREQWRFQLGFLLRFILSQHPDFTRPVRRDSWKETRSVYRPAESHWYQRLHGLCSGHQSFGDDWAPVTDWTEGFLLALLRWPGCRLPSGFNWVEQGIEEAISQIAKRISCLEKYRGDATRALILPMLAKRPTANITKRPLRACVVQTVIPTDQDFQKDLSLSQPAMRRKHRNHLSAALAAVNRMLDLRVTHKGGDERLDWLILPELAVHPDDVKTHLVPFARAHKALVLVGLTYEEFLAGQPWINSALWIIPEWSDDYGLQIRTLRQGKKHLAPDEKKRNSSGPMLQGFRPCQWLIGYPWSDQADRPPLWLTAAVCYDATDLGLAADLKSKSDILAIPALNRDVRTFDQMALALHYHMFQLVIVANTGQYGGSNAYWPQSSVHRRRIFHTHGQPQASVSFLEINDIGSYLKRHDLSGDNAKDWKHPPAGFDDS